MPFAVAQGSAVMHTPERTSHENILFSEPVTELVISDGGTILLGLHVT